MKSAQVFVYAENGKLRKTAASSKEAAEYCKVSQPGVSTALANTGLVKKKFRLFRSREEAEAYFRSRGGAEVVATAEEAETPKPIEHAPFRKAMRVFAEDLRRAADELMKRIDKYEAKR